MADPTQLEKFFTQYRDFLAQSKTYRLREFQLGFGQLKSSLQAMHKMKREFDRQMAPRFNIFTTLGVAHLEVHTHSRLLAELLDPAGSHGQGLLFLENFLRLGIMGFDHEMILQGKWEVEREKFTAQGNLDIVISNYHSKHLIVIENKIYAMEQYQQLERYDNWMQNHYYYDIPERKRLLYLTPSGINSKDLEDRGKRVSYVAVSYRTDIAKWLEDALQQVSAPAVRHILDQYVSLLSRL